MVNINNLANEIAKQLSQYTDSIKEEIDSAKEDITKEAVKELKTSSPELTGDYAKGWTKKKVGTDYVIHNKTNYQLTHLLENGHAKVGGGRVRAIPHIEPVEKKAIDKYVDRVERAIQS